MTQAGYTWKAIEDLPSDWKGMESETLKNLSLLWEEQKNKADAEALAHYSAKLQRQWAVETGLLEKLYDLEKGIADTMIELGIDAIDIPHHATSKSPEYVKSLLKDQQHVAESLFAYAKEKRSLTQSFIQEVHAALTKSQKTTEAVDRYGNHIFVSLEKGKWKTRPNTPTRPDGKRHEYCPPLHVQEEMDNLLQWHAEHVAVAPEVEAAWLHHRFVQIHPFQDGNGRVARALATFVFLQKGLFPLVITCQQRTEYLECLEKADNGDLKPLVALFTRLARDAFLRAFSISETGLHTQRTTEDVLAASRKTSADTALSLRQHTALSLADSLKDIACAEFHAIAERLQENIHDTQDAQDTQYAIEVLESTRDSEHWFREQVCTIADSFAYSVNADAYHKWIMLTLKGSCDCSCILSLHAVSKNISGVMAAVMFLECREKRENSFFADGPYSVSASPFVFTASDDRESISLSFKEWVHANLLHGLVLWQQKL